MTIEEAIAGLITANAIVGPVLWDDEEKLHRISEGVASEDTDAPYVCYFEQSDDTGFTLSKRDGNSRATLQLEVWDKDVDRCRDLASLIKDLLNEFGRGVANGVKIKALKANSAGSDHEDDESGADVRWYRRIISVQADYEPHTIDSN
jgi:hypothetical protein